MRRLRVLLVVAAMIGLWAIGLGLATAQTGPPPATDPNWITQAIAFFANETWIVLVAAAAGILFKFRPELRNFLNSWIRLLTAFIGWLLHVLGPQPAVAGGIGEVIGPAAAAAYPVLMGLLDSFLSHKLFEHWLRPATAHWPVPAPDPPRLPATVTRE